MHVRLEVGCKSNVEEFFDLFQTVLRVFDGVADRSRIVVDLPVVTALEAFVAEKVNVLVVDAGQSLAWVRLCLDMP